MKISLQMHCRASWQIVAKIWNLHMGKYIHALSAAGEVQKLNRRNYAVGIIKQLCFNEKPIYKLLEFNSFEYYENAR